MMAVIFGTTRTVGVIMITVLEVAVIETVATEVIMIIGVVMIESGGTEGCLKARDQ